MIREWRYESGRCWYGNSHVGSSIVRTRYSRSTSIRSSAAKRHSSQSVASTTTGTPQFEQVGTLLTPPPPV